MTQLIENLKSIMNRYSVIGVPIIAIGTIMMNDKYVFGAIIIAIGTIIMIYGTLKSSKESEKRITTKIVETQKQIDSLKLNPESKKEDIEKIENEFLEWADDFVKNRSKKKIELEKIDLNNKEDRSNLELIWHPQFVDFFQQIRKLIDAYNLKTGETIKYNIPSIPENLFYAESDSYNATIFFRDDIIWRFSIKPADTLSSTLFVKFRLSIANDKKSRFYEGIDFFTFVLLNVKDILITRYRNERFNMNKFPDQYKFEKDIFKQLATDLIENQLIQL